jgi:hypothetical protein
VEAHGRKSSNLAGGPQSRENCTSRERMAMVKRDSQYIAASVAHGNVVVSSEYRSNVTTELAIKVHVPFTMPDT